MDSSRASDGMSLGLSMAKKIALEDAGLAAKDVTVTKVKLDHDL